MYTKFKRRVLESEQVLSSLSVSEEVSDCWKKIEEHCGKTHHVAKSSRVHSWNTVRLFVSSTFSDFHSEREILVKKVFPVLREWCEKRRLHLIECDLRWGVPKDSTTVTAIATCMEELERCHEETDGQPFFIALLGDRYGWIPSNDDIGEELRDRYDWVDGLSITHMEILYGAYRSASVNALVLLRDSDFLANVPPDQMSRYQDQEELPQHHIMVLKQKLKDRFPSQVLSYNADVSGMESSTGREKVKLKGLETKADAILEFFKTAISRKFHSDETSDGAVQDPHDFMMEIKAKKVLGREDELEFLRSFALGNIPASQLNYDFSDGKEGKIPSYENSNTPIMAIVGDPGLGKSALSAKLAHILKEEGVNVFYHCVGVTGKSTTSNDVITRIIQSLRHILRVEDDIDMEQDEKVLVTYLHSLLEAAGQSKKHLVLIIDALNELHSKQTTEHLDWLMWRTPGKLRCIVSSTKHVPTLHRLRKNNCACMPLSGFNERSKKLMVEQFFSRYNKKLDTAQLECLISHDGATIPLWLAIACEELRVFGDFRTLTEKIQRLPGHLEGLFEEVITRLRNEDTTGCMDKFLSLMCCNLAGLPESHIRVLLGDLENKVEISLLVWSTLHMFLKPLLRTVTSSKPSEMRIQFFHNSIFQAVHTHMFPSDKDKRNWHSYLSHYYDTICDDVSLVISDLPYHLKEAGLYDRLISFVREDKRTFGISSYLASNYFRDLRCQFPVMASGVHGKREHTICHNCTLFRRTSRGHTMKDTCVICYAWAPHASGKVPMFCIRHGHTRYSPPGYAKCCVCGRQDVIRQMQPGKYCNMCSIRGSMCCELITNNK